ncbi:MAG: zinc ribbon domain-containing protein [Candidatus Heimdallarchaeota archaeon]|nr:zinc ribbon domain-containing protein [Candidatus Heimdallarchaeota archaeon]
MVKYCSRCGARVIPGAKFCRSCGNKIEIKEQAIPNQTYEERYEEETYSPREEIRSEPKVKVELSKEEEESLLVLSEIIPIQKQIEILKKDKDTLEIKFRVEEEITEKDYNTQLKKINTDISTYEKEIEEKRKVMASLSLLNLVQEVVDMRERQEKLEEIFKEARIQESTYDRLKKEYKEKEKATKAKVDEEEAKLKQFRRNLVDEKEEISSSKEELFARYSVGELSEKEYRDKIKELESRNIEGLIAAVDEVIARIARV